MGFSESKAVKRVKAGLVQIHPKMSLKIFDPDRPTTGETHLHRFWNAPESMKPW